MRHPNLNAPVHISEIPCMLNMLIALLIESISIIMGVSI